MTLHLVTAEDIRMGDLLEDRTGIWRPVTHIDNPPQISAWFFYRVSAQGVRSAMRGTLILVGREPKEV